MDKGILESYSVWAKENLEKQIEVSLKTLGINGDNDIKKAKKVGDYTVIDGDSTSYPADLFYKRNEIIRLIENQGYKNVIEEFAYTWFNRLVALRFMEVHDYLSHGFRVLSSRDGGIEPEILKNIGLVKDELKLDIEQCASLREAGKVEELFRYILFKQCNALSDILPMLFSNESSYLELLLPKTLLKGETVITRMMEIPEEDFLNEIEIIGWLYQFYNSAKKKAVNAAKKTITKDTLPAVTQLFTPDWIVRYMAENSVGRIWMESYPTSSLRSEMKYYVDNPEQTEEVQRKLDAIKYKNVNPEEIKIIEPCCGSGHILVYVFDLLYKMYEEKGYQKRDIPTLILSKNLTGLDVDKRAAQLASFSLIMKAREMNNRFFTEAYYVVPHVYEIKDSVSLIHMNYKKQIEDIGNLDEKERNSIQYLVESFRYGKTIGSLLILQPERFALAEQAIQKLESNGISNVFNIDFMNNGLLLIKQLVKIAEALTDKYDVMITNPPYIGSSSMESHVKEYADVYYNNSKSDFYAMFMEAQFCKQNGYIAIINMHSWMFLASFEKLREKLVLNRELITAVHLGARAFEMIAGEVVQTVAFVFKVSIPCRKGTYYRLVNISNKEDVFLNASKYDNVIFVSDYSVFRDVAGIPWAYWISKSVSDDFEKGKRLATLAETKKGLATSDNNRFLRLWYEVSVNNIGFGYLSNEMTLTGKHKWFPINKGGGFRRWYGNREYVINWKNDGFEIRNYRDDKGKLLSRPQNTQLNFLPSLTWSKISTSDFAARYCEGGFLFDDAAAICHSQDVSFLKYTLGFLNSKCCQLFLQILNPTINIQIGDIGNLPIIKADESIETLIDECISISKQDWDSFENSWDFLKHPLSVLLCEGSNQVEPNMCVLERGTSIGCLCDIYANWEKICQNRFTNLKAIEEKLNKLFIDVYGLEDELTPEVLDESISICLADKERDIKSLISYLIGLVMGRYSLDASGLAFAGGSWDSSKYITYQPDDDGIVPIYSKLGMSDGLTGKIIELIKLIYGEDTYRQNIDYIAEVLGKTSNESSEETLNRYLNEGFYEDHLKTYQKRPIYWMLSSGKNSGFKCLIYMHRYSADMLAAINGKYFLPESTRLKNELEELNTSVATSEGREKIRLEKERQKLAAAHNEVIEYGQVLDHMANKYIEIDLDDGVKVNYAKFQDVEIVTDAGTKVKKDLLVPIK